MWGYAGMDRRRAASQDYGGGFMKKLLAVCATALLFTTLGLAQGTASPRSSTDNQQYSDDSPRHDYGWVGLLGLAGLGGLLGRRNTANRSAELHNVDSRRAA